MIAEGGEYTPTPAIVARDPDAQPRPHERAGRRHRRHAVAQSARQTAASSTTRRTAVRPTRDITGWIEDEANALLDGGLQGVQRMPFDAGAARRHDARHDFLGAYVARSRQRASTSTRSAARASASASIRSAAPACTTGRAIAERYRLDLTVVSDEVDPTFRFMSVDWDGRSAWIRRRRTPCSG